MAKRSIITIDEDKCDGCALCIPNCPEGAIQVIDGKARLVGDLFCDGLGACIGHCPRGAITIEEREAGAYDERKVMENIIKQGGNVIKAHLDHLKGHGEIGFLKQALDFLDEKGISGFECMDHEEATCRGDKLSTGCPGSEIVDDIAREGQRHPEGKGKRVSELKQWPIQLHLAPVAASFFNGADVLLSADCVAYALADFHEHYLKGKVLVIACPKLDSSLDEYENKISQLIDKAGIRTLTIMTMEVPCCAGLVNLTKRSAHRVDRKIPIKHITVAINGSIIKEENI